MKKCSYIIILILVLSCTSKKKQYLFSIVPHTESGVHFVNEIKDSQKLNILNYLYFYNGAGVAAGDFNNDSLVDLYFTSNIGQDKLYLNKGALLFEDITNDSVIPKNLGYTTGVTTVDINNDGLLDIYISKVYKLSDSLAHNLLFVNQGITSGIPEFKEVAQSYNLDIQSYATQSAFFDFDLDGDLDMFLLNHSVKPNRSYGKGAKRQLKDPIYGDKLYENIDGKYYDVTEKSGIYEGAIGYGLGISISDINNDGYPDIYIGNDFFENDYLYINQKNKTFKEIISEDISKLGHSTHFSMGNNISDVNNDLKPDIISVDMLPEDLITLKNSAPEYNYPINNNYLKQGYAPQFMQNTLHLNRGNLNFSEVAHISGIEATEWSWSPLVSDFDNDGLKDLFVTNGILGATNDMDFINFISDEAIQKAIDKGVREDELKLISKIPIKKTKNYIFSNVDGQYFQNKSDTWLQSPDTFSNGAVAVDLDNDGDLDIVVNNVNDFAHIIENKSNLNEKPNNFLKLKFNGPSQNINGIGAKVVVYNNGIKQLAENFNTRGYLSSNEPQLNFGLKNSNSVDSLQVIWPGGKVQSIHNITANQTLVLNFDEAVETNFTSFKQTETFNTDSLTFTHKENSTLDFYKDALTLYSNSGLGPCVSVGDINTDGLDDVFFGGAKNQPSKLYLQDYSGGFVSHQDSSFVATKINEDVSAKIEDLNNDGFPELIVVSAGNEFEKGSAIQPCVYWNNKGNLIEDKSIFTGIQVNASKLELQDIDQDGDLDIILLSNTSPDQFGQTPKQFILINKGDSNFTDETSEIAPEFEFIGNATDITFGDFNLNGLPDFIVSGHWMPLTFFEKEKTQYVKKSVQGLNNSNGLWNDLEVADFDKDGDLDIIAGNWGLNTRLEASLEEPLTLYSYDFDSNSKIDPIVTYYYQGIETVFSSKEELVKKLPFINKKFLSYDKFSRASINEIFGAKPLNLADKKYVFNLATTYFENLGNLNFKPVTLPFMGQISSIHNIVSHDFNNDGFIDVLLTGNHYEISTQLSRLDASHGELFINDKKGSFKYEANPNLNIYGVVRDSEFITINKKKYLLFGRNNDSLLIIPLEMIYENE